MTEPHRTGAGPVPAEVRCGGLASRNLDRIAVARRSLWPLTGLALLVSAVTLLAASLLLSRPTPVSQAGQLPAAAVAPAPSVAPVPPVGTLPEIPRPPAVATTADIDAEAPPPRRLTVERLGIDTELVDLRVQADGSLQVPADFDVAGWHRAGTLPGDRGPAVLVGHVDSYEGPAVFYRLGELQPGDRVSVARADGSVVPFEVYGAETVSKTGFPTERVYGPTAEPELRLLTCGGSFDETVRSYRDNVVVYARVVPPATPS